MTPRERLRWQLDQQLDNLRDRLQKVPEDDAKRIELRLFDLRATVAGALQEYEALVDGGHHTSDGLKAKRRELRKRVDAEIEKEAKEVSDMTGEIEAMEAAAVLGMKPTIENGRVVSYTRTRPETKESPSDLAMHREIRDRLLQLKQHDAEDRYLRAVRSGDDPDLVAAVEGAPKAFPVVRPHVATAARTFRIENSPLNETIQARRLEQSLREHYLFRLRDVVKEAGFEEEPKTREFVRPGAA
jgi:hypothetical protein